MSSVERFHPLSVLNTSLMARAGSGEKERIEQCAKVRGHILRIDPQGVIYCERCPARWRDEGY